MISDNGTSANNGQNDAEQPPTVAGGASSALDMNDSRDRAMLRQAQERWSGRVKLIPQERRLGWLTDLDSIRNKARRYINDPIADIPEGSVIAFDPTDTCRKWCDSMNDYIRTEVSIDAMGQKDEHHASEMSNPREHTSQHIHMHEAAATDPKLADAIDVLAAAVRNAKTLPG